MARPTYEELEQKIKELRQKLNEFQNAEKVHPEGKDVLRLLDLAPYGLFFIDLSGKIMTANKTGAERLGKTVQEIIGTALRDYFPPDVSDNRRLKGFEAVRSGKPVTFDDRVKGRWYHNTIFPISDKLGKVTSLAIFGSDVTDYRLAEENLRESEKKYRELADSLPQVIFETDVKGTLTFTNRLAFSIFGYSQRDFERGLNALEMLIPEDRDRAAENIRRVLGGETLGGVEYTALRKDGSTFPVIIHSTGIEGEKGVTGLRGVMIDITDLKQAQEEMKASEERFKSLFEYAPDAYYLNDFEGNLLDGNKAAGELIGYKKEELIGNSFLKLNLLSRSEMKKAASILAKNAMGQATGPDEIILKPRDGSEVIVEIRAFPIKIKGEDLVLGIARDITERRKAEEEKKRLVARLQRAQKMEAVGTLAGGVAHDLNNILSGIVSYPDLLLLQLEEDSPLRSPIRTIRESGQKAAAIVQDLLTLARRGVDTTEVVNLNDIISDYLGSPEHIKLKSFHPDVEVEAHLGSGLLNILGSPLHLSKTVMNLISNAAEAMPVGGKILISTESRYIDKYISGYDEISEGDYAVLTVSDEGTGISPEDKEKIFEPFYTKKKMGRSGTGLGMAVVWGTVKDHKGHLDIESSKGKGTTFTLYFPATRKGRTRDQSLLSVDEYKGKGEKILVVDDVENQREIASMILSQLGYSPIAVSSGEEAVEYLRNNSVDLLILDMIMDPGMDGLDTYRKILEIHPGQKAIIASGFSETERVKETQRLCAGEYVKKPYTLEKIGIAVRNELDK